MAKIRNGLNYVGVDNNGTPTEFVIKRVDIGDWNMDTTSGKNVSHGLTSTQWKTITNISVILRNDADTLYYPIDPLFLGGESVDAGVHLIGSSTINLNRVTGSFFDTTDFDSTSYNRGWITFMYIP
jgi:hypothetical protein